MNDILLFLAQLLIGAVLFAATVVLLSGIAAALYEIIRVFRK